jgi:transporter family protein
LRIDLKSAIKKAVYLPSGLGGYLGYRGLLAMWWIYAILAAIFASLTAIFAKLGVWNINSNLATAIRTIVVLIMVWAIVLIRGEAKGMGSLSRQNVIFLVASGMATGLSWLFYFKALQMGKVSLVAPVDKLSVALTIILSVLFLGETLTLKAAIGALLIVAGTIVLISN